MNEPQLILAQYGQYWPATVSKGGEIVRAGGSAIPPVGLIPLGLQDSLDVVVSSTERAEESLVFLAQSRAEEFGADYFLIGRVRRESLPERAGFQVAFAETQAYVRNPNTLPPAASSRGHDTMGSKGEPDG